MKTTKMTLREKQSSFPFHIFREVLMKLFDELKWRGLVDNITSTDLEEKIKNGGLTFYIGTDPTADSLHIGHFLLFWLLKD